MRAEVSMNEKDIIHIRDESFLLTVTNHSRQGLRGEKLTNNLCVYFCIRSNLLLSI